MKDLKVGEMVLYVPSDTRHCNLNGKYLPITKVGKKYVYVNDMKCEKWNHNSFAIGILSEYPYGTIYQNEKDYLDSKEWNRFTCNIPTHLTREQKMKILSIVKGDINE